MRAFIRLKSYEWALVVSFVTLAIPVTLLFFRHLDDNRLTNWQWVFVGQNTVVFFFFLLVAVGVAYLFSGMDFLRRRAVLLFLFAWGLGFLFWGAPEVIVDSARYFAQAKHLRLYGLQWFIDEWGREIFAWTDLPLISFCYGLIFKFLGESRVFVQIFTTSLFALSVVLTYLLGTLLWDEEIGFHGGLFLLAIPYLYSQVPLMLVDIPTMFLLLLAIYTFARALSYGENIWMNISSISLVLAVFVKFSTWPLLSILAIIFFVYWGKDPGETLRRTCYVVVPALVVIGLVLFLKHDVFFEQIRFLFQYQRPGLGRWSEGYLSTFFFQTHPYLSLAAILSLGVAIQKRDPKYIIILFLVVLVFALQIKRSRYTIPVFPMLALAGAYGIQVVRDRFLRRFIVFSAVTTSVTVALFAYLPYLKTMSVVNLMECGRFLDSLSAESVHVVTPDSNGKVMDPGVNVMLLDLYTQKNIVYSHPSPSPETLAEVALSPLRFTWEFNIPKYYNGEDGKEAGALVVIDDDTGPSFMKDSRLFSTDKYTQRVNFMKTSNIFLHQTMVSVFWGKKE